jgi:hypothetical protein
MESSSCDLPSSLEGLSVDLQSDLQSCAELGSEAVVEAPGLNDRCFDFGTVLSSTFKLSSIFGIDTTDDMLQVAELDTYKRRGP